MRLLDPEKTALELLARTGQSGPPVDLDRVAALWPGSFPSATATHPHVSTKSFTWGAQGTILPQYLLSTYHRKWTQLRRGMGLEVPPK